MIGRNVLSLLVAWVVIAGWAPAAEAATLSPPLGAQGTISVQIQTDKPYLNGPGVRPIGVEILEIPGLAKLRFAQSSTVCELQWLWALGVQADNLSVEIPELPGPADYFLQYTWDAAAGRFTGYVNGTALRLPETQVTPWTVPEVAEIHLAEGPFNTALVSSQGAYLDEAAARAQVPAAMLGQHAELFGVREAAPTPLNVASRLGAVCYESAMDTAESVDGWKMEGPGSTAFDAGWMTMASTEPDSSAKEGHIVFWCPLDLPARFVADWEMEILSKEGLCIVFFAARGLAGEDIFAPSLPARSGIFRQYTQGALDCYHISYYANTPTALGRITSNMRKNKGFHLVENGPPGIKPASDSTHAVRLIKDGAHFQLLVDVKVVIDFVDDGQRYGPVLDGGKIGFRQMQWTTARYRNLVVHALDE